MHATVKQIKRVDAHENVRTADDNARTTDETGVRTHLCVHVAFIEPCAVTLTDVR